MPRLGIFNSSSDADAADVEALCAQIVPSGATPGAREAHAVYFIDQVTVDLLCDDGPGLSPRGWPSFRPNSTPPIRG